MNFGINLVGISHLLHKERHPIARTYKSCVDNYFQEIYNPLAKKFNVKVYLTTYISDEVQNIINIYNPQKALFLNYARSHQIKTFIHALDLMEGEDLDFVMMSRFDIFFNPGKARELEIKLDKFNFFCREYNYWDDYGFVNDCFMVLPIKYLQPYKKACINLLNNPPRPPLMDMHGVHKFLCQEIGEENISFMTGEKCYVSNCNPIYEIKRAT